MFSIDIPNAPLTFIVVPFHLASLCVYIIANGKLKVKAVNVKEPATGVKG